MSQDVRLRTLAEVERIYRLRHGTAGDAWRAGKLPGKRRGNRVLVSAKRAEELYGVSP